MIYFDVTKAGRTGHRSGLQRVSARLRESLGPAATAVTWDGKRRGFRTGGGADITADDWLLTGEIFAEDERPGFGDFLRSGRIRTAAIFHDAIPLRFPHITWPQSVARHPGYLKLLASFDRVWVVSEASRVELTGFWRWQGLEKTPPVEVLALGADFNGAPRITPPLNQAAPALPPVLLSVGILEPRKNQLLLLEVCEDLWNEGRRFELHLVGRVNPHFGRPTVDRIKVLQRKRSQLHHHPAAGDDELARLYAVARASVFPTLAEGCGLPLLESLWQGVPCVCSDLPVLRENAGGGGCLPVAGGERAAWTDALRRILADEALHARLTREAGSRPLPTWAAAAVALRATLG
jgi:glycosyltransferase involved in cell wall biosynthesis